MSPNSPFRSSTGGGGQPGMCRSTGTPPRPAGDRVASGEHAAILRRNRRRPPPISARRCGVGALQRLAHVPRHRPGHQQHVGVARRGDETKAEALEIVEGVAERVDFELAAVARAGVDLADGKAAAELAVAALLTSSASSASSVVGVGRVFRERALNNAFEQQRRIVPPPLKVVPGIGAVERLIADRKIRDDVVLRSRLRERPLKPRGVAQVTGATFLRRPGKADENVAAKALDQRWASPGAQLRRDLGANRPGASQSRICRSCARSRRPRGCESRRAR